MNIVIDNHLISGTPQEIEQFLRIHQTYKTASEILSDMKNKQSTTKRRYTKRNSLYWNNPSMRKRKK